MAPQDAIHDTLNAICESYVKAREKHAPMRGPHEGYAVLLEEVDELWDEVKAWQPKPEAGGDTMNEIAANSVRIDEYNARMRAMRKEALHVAAMALAFLLEVTPPSGT
jgi:hypothetical protein